MEENRNEMQLSILEKEPAGDVIVRQGEIRLVGKKTRIVTANKRQPLPQIKAFWQQCEEDGTLQALRALSPNAKCYASATDNFGKMEYDYWIAVEADESTPVPEGYGVIETLETNYARFRAEGPACDAVYNLWSWIYRRWFTRGEYKHGISPELELYPFEGRDSESCVTEIRVPVKKIDKKRMKRSQLPMMLPPLGALLGLVIGINMENITAGLLVGFLGGYIGSIVVQHILDEREVDKTGLEERLDAPKKEEKKSEEE